MGFWVEVGLLALSIAVSYFLRPEPKSPAPPPEPELDQLTVPQVSASDPIPKVYGTKWITSANVVWYGDLRTEPIKKEAEGGKK